MKTQVLKSELIFNRYSVMSISSAQTYNLLTKDCANGEIVKNVSLNSSAELYSYFTKVATQVEKKALNNIVQSLLKHNLV